MSSNRPEALNPEGHIATLDPICMELLLSMYGPQIRAMKEDVSKGFFFWPDLLATFFEQFSKHPVLECENMLRFGLFEKPPEGSNVIANSVRISIPILRNWPAVQARARQLEKTGDRIKPNPARRSTTSLKLDFGTAALPTLSLPAPDPNQIELNMLASEAMGSPAPDQPDSAPPTPATPQDPPASAVGAISDDDAALSPAIRERRKEFEDQLSTAAPRVAANGAAHPQTADDVARITGKRKPPGRR